MGVPQTSDLARNGNGQSAIDALLGLPVIHVLGGFGRRSFPKVDGLICAILITDEHEAATANTGVVRRDDTHAEGRPNNGINGVTLDRSVYKDDGGGG